MVDTAINPPLLSHYSIRLYLRRRCHIFHPHRDSAGGDKFCIHRLGTPDSLLSCRLSEGLIWPNFMRVGNKLSQQQLFDKIKNFLLYIYRETERRPDLCSTDIPPYLRISSNLWWCRRIHCTCCCSKKYNMVWSKVNTYFLDT